MASSVPGPCGHILYPLCRCNPTTGDVLQAATTKPALTPKGVDIVAGAAGIPPVAPAAPSPAPSESTHAGPAPKKRRTAAPPWSPNYQDPVTGEYPNRRPRRKSEEEQLAELEAAIFAALESPDSGAAQKVLDELAAADARASFAEFFRQAWHVTDPGTELVWNWHLALLCAVVQVIFFDWLKGKNEKDYFPAIRNVLVNIPPGTSKSRCLSVLFPAWAWLHCPGMKFLCLSVNDDAMLRDARLSRDVIRSPWYLKTFGVEWSIKSDQDAGSNYGITSGGERISMASKSEIVGLRADCLIIDDPNNPKKSENEKERAEVNSLWSTNQWNRVNDLAKSLRIGVQQRTHEEDWTGAVLEAQGEWSEDNRGGWLHIVLPAEYESSRKFVMPERMQRALRAMDLAPEDIVVEDPRTDEGESLDPIRLSRSVLADLRKHWRGTNNYAGQMQQRPASSEGNKISSKWWGWCKLAGGVREDLDALGISGPTSAEGRPRPAGTHSGEAKVIHQRHYSPGEWDFDWITISIDCASKKTEKGSNYGILVVAGKGGQRFVLDDATQRGALHEIIEVLVGSDANPERPRDKGLVQRWRPTSILIEDKAAGDNVMDTLREQMAAGDVPMVVIETCDPGNADKEMRLEAATPYIKNGQVFLLDGADWLEEFVEEFRLYPAGKRDDRVDALSQILNYKRAAADEWPDY